MTRVSSTGGKWFGSGAWLLGGLLLVPVAGQQPSPAPKRPSLEEARKACQLLRQFATGGGREAYRVAGGQMTVPFPDGTDLDVGDILAYEEHQHFTYAVVDLSKAYGSATEKGARLLRRLIHLKPATFVVEDQIQTPAAADKVRWLLPTAGAAKTAAGHIVVTGKGDELTCESVLPGGQGGKLTEAGVEWLAPAVAGRARYLLVFHRRQAGTSVLPKVVLGAAAEPLNLGIVVQGKRHTLSLPKGRLGPGSISISDKKEQPIVARRLLPSGVMPHGPEGVQLMERWDRAYRGKGKPGWDTGRPSTELNKLIAEGLIKPGKAIDLGCGAGTNAIYLAGKGFDVTGIDVAPTGLNWARDRAGKAKVKVRWLLADVLAPPALEPVDFIFDRGCYHHLRRINAPGYVETLRRCTRPGSQVLILAGNANEKEQWGPPRVKEAEIRGDFAKSFTIERLQTIHFDAVDPNAPKRALAWSILLKRK